MKELIKTIIVCAAFAFISNLAQAQSISVNTKFGAVSMDELAMNVYQPDTSAVAVYLYLSENRYLSVAGGYLQLVTKHRQRIKILKDAGREYGDFEIRLNTRRKPSEMMSGLKVVTYNLEGGKMVETKLNSKNVYTTKLNDSYNKVNFAAENVKVGSVIEVQWQTSVGTGAYMPNIYLQRYIPINLGEMTIDVPRYIVFTSTMQGTDSAHCKFSHNLDYNVVDTYIVRDMPAFRPEPKMIAPLQYMVQGNYALKAITAGGSGNRFHNSSWDSIDEDIAKSTIFTEMYGICHFRQEVDDILSRGLSEEEVIGQIREVVVNRIKWNEEIDLFPTSGLLFDRVVSGSNADINAQVAACLLKAGFDVAPICLKLRSSGTVNKVDLREYDTFILYAVSKTSGNTYIFDAADQAGYLNVLPLDMLVTNGRLIGRNGHGQFVDLTSLSTPFENSAVQASINADGELEAVVSIKYRGAASYSFKEYYQSLHGNDEKFMDTFQTLLNGYTIESCEVIGGKEWSGASQLKIKLRQAVPTVGGNLLVNPFVYNFFEVNVFKSETRKYPVEFRYPENISYNFMLTLPEGWEIEKYPQDYALYSVDLETSVNMICRPGDNSFSMKYVVDMNKIFVLPESYQSLRRFWDKMCAAYNDRVVIRMK